MPQYRRLYAKIRDSADVNDMPSDFCRLAWTWLPCTLDSEGRCYDDPQWLRSVLFPKRRDVTAEMMSDALQWWAERKMIVRYTVNGQAYFYVPSFKEYQTGTDKEAKSVIPAPNKKSNRSRVTPELVESKSGPTPELVKSYSTSDSDADSDAKANALNGADAPSPSEPLKPGANSLTPQQQMVHDLACVMGLDDHLNGARLARLASDLLKQKYLPAQVTRIYSRDGPYYRDDWRGKKGQAPTESVIRETIHGFSNGKAQAPTTATRKLRPPDDD